MVHIPSLEKIQKGAGHYVALHLFVNYHMLHVSEWPA
jgi:hypothetical protein